VIYTGYTFNMIKKNGTWKGYMEEEKGEGAHWRQQVGEEAA
jgi:hypothetical protein